MTTLKPSPAITVSEHTSIGDTIRTLIEHKVGAVIVTSYSAPHKPVGIFTERDLLKWVFDFKDSNQWTVAIGTIMTRKLITLSILNLEQANDIMLKNNIRHLPIIYHDENEETHLAGLISMRDAFRNLVELNKLEKQAAKQSALSKKMIMIIAKNIRERNLQRNILSSYPNLKVINEDFDREPDLKELLKEITKAKVLVLDIDDFDKKYWSFLLKLILEQAERPSVFVVFNPYLHEKNSINTLKTIASEKTFHAFSKPLSLIEYLTQVEKSLEMNDFKKEKSN
jgi:CBS domain-containing protein